MSLFLDDRTVPLRGLWVMMEPFEVVYDVELDEVEVAGIVIVRHSRFRG